MNLQIISKKAKNLTEDEYSQMNNAQKNVWGEYEMESKTKNKSNEFFMLKKNSKIVSFGLLIPINVKLENKKYSVLGLAGAISLEKDKGYGKILNSAIISFLKSKNKTGVGFTLRHNIKKFEKMGYKIKKKGIRNFLYQNPKGKLIKDNEGDMIYYEGKDKFVTKLLESKEKAITDTEFW
jgi:hypothetical protein